MDLLAYLSARQSYDGYFVGSFIGFRMADFGGCYGGTHKVCGAKRNIGKFQATASHKK
jgi:hypothetical protein